MNLRFFGSGKFRHYRWKVVTRCVANIRSKKPERLKGVIESNGKSPCYVVLGSSRYRFDQLETSEGILVSGLAIYEIAVDIEPSVKSAWAVLLIEYDEQGRRLATRRWRKNGLFRYCPGPEVHRVLLALRVEGDGALCVNHLGCAKDSALLDRILEQPQHDHSAVRPRKASRIVLLEKGMPQGPVTLSPGHMVRICTLDVDAGHYNLEVRLGIDSSSSQVEPLRVISVHADGIADRLLSEEGNPREMTERTLFEVPHTSDNPDVRYVTRFTVLEARDLVTWDLVVTGNDPIEIEQLSISSYTPASEELLSCRHLQDVANYLSSINDAHEIRCVVYADISLNRVDGSSVWMSSLLSMLTAMGRCLLVSREDVFTDVVLSNVQDASRLTILSPRDFRRKEPFDIETATAIIQALDDQLPQLQNLVVRGCAVATSLLATRRFRNRAFPYLTDFYELGESEIVIPEAKAKAVRIAASQAGALLVQNIQIEETLRRLANRSFSTCHLPPTVPDIGSPKFEIGEKPEGVVRIGYAGKVNPLWGVIELLEWAEALIADGIRIELYVATSKISGVSGGIGQPDFGSTIHAKFEEMDVRHFTDLNREQSMSLMNAMDFVWCWRPAELEERTLEVSTKLVEMIALGARCICYPNSINRELLGDDYPYFATDLHGVKRMFLQRGPRDDDLAEEVRRRFGTERVGQRLEFNCLNASGDVTGPNILASGNGLKFLEPYLSDLKVRGHNVKVDPWEWGRACNLDHTEKLATWAELIFCEWGLANAVYHSQNLRSGQKLFVRCHAQEVREKAQQFGQAIDANNVQKFIFVSERIRRKAIELFGWPEEKTVLIPNYLLEDEFQLLRRPREAAVRLGLVGMVPNSKRFDRALDLVEALQKHGISAELHVKGHRPEELGYMYSSGRIAEMKYYHHQYERFRSDPIFKGRVHFHGWDNDMASWYGGIDYILSTSDHESFHYALADGVLTGCHPLIWPWQDAERVYPREWIVEDVEAAMQRIIKIQDFDDVDLEKLRKDRRDWLVERYGHQRIFAQLDEMLGV